MFKKNNLILVLFFVLNTNVFAGVLIEPYLGFSKSLSGETTYSNNTAKNDYSYSGVNIGGRLGYSFLGLMGGLDYSMAKHNIKTTSGSTENKDGISRSQFGIFVGYELPILLRVWGTYFLSASVDGEDSPKTTGQSISTDTSLEGGSGFALGAGFTGLPFVSINLEYRKFDYDIFKNKGIKNVNHSGSSLSEILLSVSLPLNI